MISRLPVICICGDHAFAAITRGYIAIVDPADSYLLCQKWTAKPDKKTVYVQRQMSGKNVRLHRLIVTEGEVVDHINHNALDNRRRNLRGATFSQNTANRRIYRQDRPMGVYKARYAYRATIWVDGKNKHLGCFKTEMEAVEARDKAAKDRWGDFASLNALAPARPAEASVLPTERE